MRLSLLVAALLHITSDYLCVATSGLNDSQQNPIVIETIHRFNTNISLEDLAVRHTGEIIVGLDNLPTLYLIDPKVNGSAKHIHTFDDYTDIHGIVEVDKDQFYVTCSNLTLATHVAGPGIPSVFHINMTGFPEHIEVNKVSHFPHMQILTGMTLLSKKKGLVYVADCRVGVVSVLNVHTGEHFVAVNNSLTNEPPGVSPLSLSTFGVRVVEIDELDYQNGGVSVSNVYLYVSNFIAGIIGRVLINPETGLATGEPEIIHSNLSGVGDFVIDKNLNIYTALFFDNQFIRVDGKTNEVSVLAGNANSTEFKWAVAVRFGRLETDKHDLYATINGGFLQPDGVGGTLFRLKLGDLAVL